MTAVRDYGLAPQLRARLMGAALGSIGLALLLMTLVVAVLELPVEIMTGLVALAVIAVFSLGFFLVRRWFVVRLDEAGYEVRFVRGAGARSARWTEVEDLATATNAGTEVVVLRLRDGRTTTIPVNLIEGDREEFVTELRRRLQRSRQGPGRR